MDKYKIKIADLIFQIFAENKMEIEDAIIPFIIHEEDDEGIKVYVSWKWENINLENYNFDGKDSINRYYSNDNNRCCVTSGGYRGALAYALYDNSLSEFHCLFNNETFPYAPRNLGILLRVLPIKEILMHNGILFLHSSQILHKGKGLVFTAASGTGKTTHAKLWNNYRGAEIICNDRTLVRKQNGTWYTYGYPIDGSEPVRSSAKIKLACPVVLNQSKENCVEELSPAKALAYLMSQLVLDSWNVESRNMAIELLISLIGDVPVYKLQCTKDKEAVEVLEKVLVEAGVL